MNTPVLLMAFTRLDTAQKIFNEIRRVQPKRFFMYVDGPRETHPEDGPKLEAVKDLLKQIDWECEVKTMFPEKNMGFMEGMRAAISWFFDHVEEGMIFEDDCLPDPTFFPFVEEMLEKYRDDERVMHISGDNFQFGRKRGNASYYFSVYPNSWGWATWKRAWKHVDPDMKSFPLFKEKRTIQTILSRTDEQRVWMDTFEKSYTGTFKTWDYVWVYTIFERGGLCVMPNVNLISNIGFGAHGTHTLSSASMFANIPTESMIFPLVHPTEISPDKEADHFTFKNLFKPKRQLGRKLKSFMFKITPRRIKDIVKTMLGPKGDLEGRLQRKYADFTMIPKKIFVENLRLALRFADIKGSVVECGVWRGGMSAGLAELLGSGRSYHLFDSFEGLPPAQEVDGQAAKAWQSDKNSPIYFDNCKAEMTFAENAMRMSGAKNVRIIKGWFNETLPNFTSDEPIAILRLDGDWYESTRTCLENLYPRVAKGGAVIIDDYDTWEGCRKAVEEYRKGQGIQEEVQRTPNGVCYMIKK
ncbi:MAG: hypothetical protein JWN89_738 [Parcubacteria group bacterium]|nr:hypothetical protein [Parcubacteria group bacterium]